MTPTAKQIQRKYKSIQSKHAKLNEQLTELQQLCQHSNLEKKHGSNTGNYDTSSDCYWIDYNCPDCRVNWRKYV